MFRRAQESSKDRAVQAKATKKLHSDVETKNVNIQKITAFVLIYRWVNALLVQTSFVPDEYWQSLEVAHKMAFGYGYLTWEWKTALRGYTYPAIFALLFKLLAVLGLDNPTLLIFLPRMLQATFSAGQDVALYLLSWRLYNDDVAKWTLFCHLTSWFGFYTATRTLTNTMESVCTTIGMLYYPWPGSRKSRDRGCLTRCILLAALSCIIRPTSAILWAPLFLWHLHRSQSKISDIFFKCLPLGVVALLCSWFVDRLFYGKWVFVQYNFLLFNVFRGMGGFYGTHPWHWYITQGLPVVLGAHLPLMTLGARDRRLLPIVMLVAWVAFVYSLLSHKEFRFVLPVLPLCMLMAGSYLSKCSLTTKKISVALLLLLNIPVALYTGLVHQRGTIDVMSYLRQELRSKVGMQNVLFLMPCHSTPFFSHLHIDAELRFLTCEPNLRSVDSYVDEADVFYEDPVRWLQESHSGDYTGYIVMFDVLEEKINSFLQGGGYQKVAEFFHSHFPEGRVGSKVVVFQRTAEPAVKPHG